MKIAIKMSFSIQKHIKLTNLTKTVQFCLLHLPNIASNRGTKRQKQQFSHVPTRTLVCTNST